MSTRFSMALRYDLRSMMKGAGVFLGAMALIMAFFASWFNVSSGSGQTSFTGLGISGIVFMLVMGIVCVREDLRVLSQCGVTRRTAFLTELTALAAVAAAVAAAGEALTATVQAVAGGDLFFTGDLYQILYLDGWGKNGMTAGEHGASILFNFGFMMALAMLGQFFSLLYWRMSKFWIVAVSVGIPVLTNAVPWLLVWLGLGDAMVKTALDVAQFLTDSLWNFLAAALLGAAVLAAVNWLLLRRMNIRSAK